MAIVQLQLKKSFLSPPPVGKWAVYSSMWFSTATIVPSTAVLDAFNRLMNGRPAVGQATLLTSAAGVINTDVNGGLVSAWQFSGGSKTRVGDYPVTIVNDGGAGLQRLPSQTQICVGYRSTTGANTRLGRSRFFIGPCSILSGYSDVSGGGGLRLTNAGVDVLVGNVVSCITALRGLGWDPVVQSNRRILASHNPVQEVYVDNVFDVIRTRRAWVTYQKRQAV